MREELDHLQSAQDAAECSIQILEFMAARVNKDPLINPSEYNQSKIFSIAKNGHEKESKIDKCNVEQICYIIGNIVITDEKNQLNVYKDTIIKYFMENKINGRKFIFSMNREKVGFIQDLMDYINIKDNKLDKQLAKFLHEIQTINLENISFAQ